MASDKPRRVCVICRTPDLRYDVDKALMMGTTPTALERAMRAAGRPLKAETITNHRDRCPGAAIRSLVKDKGEAVTVKELTEAVSGDFASMVRNKAAVELAAGRLRVTTKDGLAATALLDRRAEKEKDREFIMNLARLISGAGQGAPSEIVEGEFTDLGDGHLLAPPEARLPVE